MTVEGAPTADDLTAEQAAACEALLDELPDTLLGQERREVAPDGALAAAWGDPVVELRCGVPEPRTFRRTSECVSVDGVDWFVPGDDLVAPEGETVTFTAVYREALVEVVEPVAYGPPAELLADLSAVVAATVEATDSCL